MTKTMTAAEVINKLQSYMEELAYNVYKEKWTEQEIEENKERIKEWLEAYKDQALLEAEQEALEKVLTHLGNKHDFDIPEHYSMAERTAYCFGISGAITEIQAIKNTGDE